MQQRRSHTPRRPLGTHLIVGLPPEIVPEGAHSRRLQPGFLHLNEVEHYDRRQGPEVEPAPLGLHRAGSGKFIFEFFSKTPNQFPFIMELLQLRLLELGNSSM